MIDTHCHLTHDRFAKDLDGVVAAAREAGLSACITIGTGVEDGQAAAAIAERFRGFVHCTTGIDPFTAHQVGDGFDEELSRLESLLADGSRVALGEVGLDYHYDLDPRDVQAERFEKQLDLAERLDLPVVIHVREAHTDMAAILAAHPRSHGVIHSFTAGPAEAETYLELGWHLAFNGVATFPGAPEVREAAMITPSERLLVETDAPYLAPVPCRGRRCEPGHVAHTLAVLAGVRGEEVGRLDRLTTENAVRLFRLPPSTAERVPS